MTRETFANPIPATIASVISLIISPACRATTVEPTILFVP